jgi:hypothetical protein
MAENETLAELLRRRGEQFVSLPTEATRFLTYPQGILKLLGLKPNERLSGFSAGYAGVPQKSPSDIGVIDPRNIEYSKGYGSGEEMGMMTALAAPLAPLAKPVGKALGKQAYQMTEDMLAKQGLMPSIVPRQSQFVPNVEAGQEMMVMHNLTPEKLASAERLGGMPSPSLAISKTEMPIKGFGDITLVGGKEMAIPSKTNPAFKSDAYTKRAPTIDYQIDYKSQQNLNNLFSDVKDKIHNGNYDLYKLSENFGKRADNGLLEAKFLDEKGILPNLNDYKEPYKQKADIRDLIKKNKNEYEDWLQGFDESLPANKINVKEKIFKGYTPSGNRKYAEANLENIVKEMKGGASSEGWDYGVGNLRALSTPKFKNLNEIKGSRNRIISNEDFGQVKDAVDKDYYSILDKLRGINDNYDAKDMLLEIAETKNLNAINRVYKDVPESLKKEIGSFMSGLKQMPTEYFEIKPQRSVGIGEFKGAIVPSDVSPKTMSILEKNGIKEIYKYSDANERKSLIQKFGKEMFAGVPIIGLSRKEQLEEQFNNIKK